VSKKLRAFANSATARIPSWPNPKARGGKSAFAGVLVRLVLRVYGSGMMDWTNCSAVERVPGKVSGAWLFKNTRVPVRALFENLEGGATVEQFLEWFPGVNREQVMTVLKFTESSLAEVVA